MHGYRFVDDIELIGNRGHVSVFHGAKGVSDEDLVAKGVAILKRIRQGQTL